MKKGVKIMLIIIFVIFALIVVYFNIPYSALKNKFNKDLKQLISNASNTSEVFTLEEISDLPDPIKKYFIQCNFIDKKKMSYMKATYNNVRFSLNKNNKPIKINYIQYNFIEYPNRIAFIDTSMYGIPFQGYDKYVEGIGSMTGVLGKTITLFNQLGEDMNKAILVTILSESLIAPNIALQEYIKWEAIDERHVKGTITYYDISASGIFTFNDKGQMVSFTTNDRELINTDGTRENVSWTAKCDNYVERNGFVQPTKLQAVWNYPDKDFIYFDSDNIDIEYFY